MGIKKLVLAGFLLLIFFQELSIFVESIYSKCLLRLQITSDLFALLFFLSPLLLIVLPKRKDILYLKVFVILIIITRLSAGFFPTNKLYITGIGVGIFLMALPWLFKWMVSDKDGITDVVFSIAIAAFFLIAYNTFDGYMGISENKFINLIFLIPVFSLKSLAFTNDAILTEKEERAPLIYSLLGASSVFLLIYFVFSNPRIISRWSETNYTAILVLSVLSLFFVFYVFLTKQEKVQQFLHARLLFLNICFIIFLMLTIAVQQLAFPDNINEFPVSLNKTQWFYKVPVIITVLLWPVIIIDFGLFLAPLKNRRIEHKKWSIYLIITVSVVFLVHVFGHIFTTVWGYVLPVSAFFKDKFWLVHAIPCLLLLMALIKTLKPKMMVYKGVCFSSKWSLLFCAVFVVFAAFGVNSLESVTPQYDLNPKTLKIMTFNIQQGVNLNGDKSHKEQLDLIKSYDPDIIGLQECDPLRISGGNFDIVGYYAQKLGYYSYYGASPVTGTFGVALLSKYPIESSKTYFLASEYEQVVMVASKIKVGNQYFNVSVNHPAGNDVYKTAQVEQILDLNKNQDNVICLGDFNLSPNSKYYDMITTQYIDSWNKGEEDNENKERCSSIDHIFLSPEIKILKSSCINTTSSDHNAVCTEISTTVKSNN